jgi:16S rRNA (adenine1518-N6/adenine1519-N6)-dimethyltransferase
MKLTNQKTLFEILQKFNFRTQKELGQNFLLCSETLDAIIEAADIQKEDAIIEIGPGMGVLTQRIVQSPAVKIDLLEIDTKVIPILRYVLEKTLGETVWKKQSQRINIQNISALDYIVPHNKYLLVANIPYYLTSPILRHYLTSKFPAKRLVLLVQKEVAEKICCKDNNESVLSLQVKIYGKPEIIKLVSKDKFFPSPKVDSAILKIEVYDECLISPKDMKDFWILIKHAFSQRRKKIGNTLGKAFSIDFNNINIQADRRPQTLSITEWKDLINELAKS